MKNYVTDTHALFWYLTHDKRLGRKANEAFQKAAKGEAIIWIPTIVMAELFWILEKQDRTNVFFELFEKLETAQQFEFIDFTITDVLLFEQLASIPEMHDRIIAGVAKKLDVPCLTKDEEILQGNLVKTIW